MTSHQPNVGNARVDSGPVQFAGAPAPHWSGDNRRPNTYPRTWLYAEHPGADPARLEQRQRRNQASGVAIRLRRCAQPLPWTGLRWMKHARRLRVPALELEFAQPLPDVCSRHGRPAVSHQTVHAAFHDNMFHHRHPRSIDFHRHLPPLSTALAGDWPVCDRCVRSRRRCYGLAGFLLVAMVANLVALCIVVALDYDSLTVPLAVALLPGSLPFGLVIAVALFSKGQTPMKFRPIDDERFVYVDAHPDFRAGVEHCARSQAQSPPLTKTAAPVPIATNPDNVAEPNRPRRPGARRSKPEVAIAIRPDIAPNSGGPAQFAMAEPLPQLCLPHGRPTRDRQTVRLKFATGQLGSRQITYLRSFLDSTSPLRLFRDPPADVVVTGQVPLCPACRRRLVVFRCFGWFSLVIGVAPLVALLVMLAMTMAIGTMPDLYSDLYLAYNVPLLVPFLMTYGIVAARGAFSYARPILRARLNDGPTAVVVGAHPAFETARDELINQPPAPTIR